MTTGPATYDGDAPTVDPRRIRLGGRIALGVPPYRLRDRWGATRGQFYAPYSSGIV